MASCHCGVQIVWVAPRGNPDDRFPIDSLASSYSGPGRWFVVEYGSPWLVEPVDANDLVPAYADHRLACPLVSAADRQRVTQALDRGDDDAAAAGGPAAGQRSPYGAG